MMKKRWYVIDGVDNTISWNDAKEAPEYFNSHSAAVKRARELAEETPHIAMMICEASEYAVAETKPVEVRKTK